MFMTPTSLQNTLGCPKNQLGWTETSLFFVQRFLQRIDDVDYNDGDLW